MSYQKLASVQIDGLTKKTVRVNRKQILSWFDFNGIIVEAAVIGKVESSVVFQLKRISKSFIT